MTRTLVRVALAWESAAARADATSLLAGYSGKSDADLAAHLAHAGS